MPALLTSTSIDWKRDSAVSTILAAVAGSPIWPSTRATWLEATTSVDWVTVRELATTLKPRSTNAFTIPAPIPCQAPATMAVFCGPLMVVHLKNVLSLEKSIHVTLRDPCASGIEEHGRRAAAAKRYPEAGTCIKHFTAGLNRRQRDPEPLPLASAIRLFALN